MIYGAILASGKGTRMNSASNIPKQFMKLGDKPIIIHTIEKMLESDRFDYLYIAVPHDLYDYSIDMISEYIDTSKLDKINIISGGKERMDSIQNIITSISKNDSVNEDDIIVIHDAVRPFITKKIIDDSIEGVKQYGAVVASIPVSDTLLISEDGNNINQIPKRSLYYKGQTPDSFNLKLFINLFNNLTEEQKKEATGTSQVCSLNNYPIHIVPGDDINFKITTESDLVIAESIIKGSDQYRNKSRNIK